MDMWSDCSDKEILQAEEMTSEMLDDAWDDMTDEELLNGCSVVATTETEEKHDKEMTFDELLDYMLAKPEKNK